MGNYLEDQLHAALQQAHSQRQRVWLSLSGEREHVRHRARQLAEATADAMPLCNTDPLGNALPMQGLQGALGSTSRTLIFDTFGGFDPDALAMLAGTVGGGGLVLLLTPPLADWLSQPDPFYDRLAVYPYSRDDITQRYLTRLHRLLTGSGISGEEPHLHWHLRTPPVEAPECLPPSSATADQIAVVNAISDLMRDRSDPHQCLLIHADRGRGKSSSLGLAAAALAAQDRPPRMLVTAPHRRAAEQLFLRAGDAVQLRFLGPDELIRQAMPADLLLVDEAAAIPLPLLQSLALQYRRTVFASTLHGYEGAGRGFALRFERFLAQHAIRTIKRLLQEPTRYAKSDWLEASLNEWLIPTARTPLPADAPEADELTFHALDRDALAENETLLADVFGLLVDSHYQTRPLDLQHLLDGPNIEVFTLQQGEVVVAAAWIAIEGQIDDAALCSDILDGRRRPRGHLLAQRLAYEHMDEAFLHARIARVVRIAVQPDYQQRGFGSQLLSGIVAHYRQTGFAAIGSAFGDTSALARFWHRRGFVTAHLGEKPNAASGQGSRQVLCDLSGQLTESIARAAARAGIKSGPFCPTRLSDMPGYAEELRRFIAGRRDIDASRQVLRATLSQLDDALQDTIATQNHLKVLEKPLKTRQHRALANQLRELLQPLSENLPDLP